MYIAMGSPTFGSSTAASAMPHFCNSAMSMTMYMDGFRSTLFAYLFDEMDDNDDAPPCLNFLWKRWTLDTPAKFAGAMVCIVILGITAEGMAAARSGGGVQKWAHKLAQRCCYSSNSFGGDDGRASSTRQRRRSTTKCQRWFVKMCIISTHVLQALVGYILMLAAMSYSLELLGSVLLGLGLGYATFFDLDDHDLLEDGNGGRYEEDGLENEEEEDANDDAGNDTATGGAVGQVGAGTPSCCDVAGRGPPRRAFPFLRSPVPTLAGVGRSNRRMSPRDGGGNGNDGDADEADAAMALHGGSHGDGADNLSLHEDDKMTPLL